MWKHLKFGKKLIMSSNLIAFRQEIVLRGKPVSRTKSPVY